MVESVSPPGISDPLSAITPAPLASTTEADLYGQGEPIKLEHHTQEKDTLLPRPATRWHQRLCHRGLWLSLCTHLLGLTLFYWLALHPGPVLAPSATVQVERLIHATLIEPGKPAPVQEQPLAPKPTGPHNTQPLNHSRQEAKPTEMSSPPRSQAQHQATPKHASPATEPKPVPRNKPIRAKKLASHKAQQPPTPASASYPPDARRTAVTMPTASHQADKQERPAPPVSTEARLPAVAAHAQEVLPKIVPARYRGRPAPVSYPLLARKRGIEGEALIEVWLDQEGEQLKRVIIRSSGHSLLDLAALRAVAQSQFAPYEESGQSHPSRLRIPIRFKLTTP